MNYDSNWFVLHDVFVYGVRLLCVCSMVRLREIDSLEKLLELLVYANTSR